MARNVEIKARVPDLDRVRSKVAALASSPPERLQQTDTFFAVPNGRLKVREFADGSGELIAYDRPDRTGPKQSIYTRSACPSGRVLADILSRVLPLRGVVIKTREVFLVGRTRVHLDRVVNLGSFVELEVVLGDGEQVEAGEREAHDLLRAFEISSDALIARAYIDLLEAQNANRKPT
jgi:adenylate cyclase class IV